MAKLTTKMRDAIPASKFGMPGERKYPMPDKSHAANAKSRASGAEAKGQISAATKSKIDAKADRVLGVNPAKAGSKQSADGVTHNPLFTTRGPVCSK